MGTAGFLRGKAFDGFHALVSIGPTADTGEDLTLNVCPLIANPQTAEIALIDVGEFGAAKRRWSA